MNIEVTMFGRSIATTEVALSALATLNTKLQEEIGRLEKANVALQHERDQWEKLAIASQRQREREATGRNG